LDLLDIIDNPASLKPPTYIREGLLWLIAQLDKKQFELGLTQVIESDDTPSADEAPAEGST